MSKFLKTVNGARYWPALRQSGTSPLVADFHGIFRHGRTCPCHPRGSACARLNRHCGDTLLNPPKAIRFGVKSCRNPRNPTSCGFEDCETIPFPGADSIFSICCGAISGRLRIAVASSRAAVSTTETSRFKRSTIGSAILLGERQYKNEPLLAAKSWIAQRVKVPVPGTF
jgi:hypothetical protein